MSLTAIICFAVAVGAVSGYVFFEVFSEINTRAILRLSGVIEDLKTELEDLKKNYTKNE